MLRKWQNCLLPPSATAPPSSSLLEWLGREAGCTFRLHQAWPGVPMGSWKEVVAVGIEGRGGSLLGSRQLVLLHSTPSMQARRELPNLVGLATCWMRTEVGALMPYPFSPNPKRLVFCLHVLEAQDDAARVVQRLTHGKSFTPLSWASSLARPATPPPPRPYAVIALCLPLTMLSEAELLEEVNLG